MRCKGRSFIVTGGTSGIGLAGVRRIVAEGGRVLLTGTSPDKLAAVGRELGDRVTPLANDAGAIAGVDDLVRAARSFAPIDGLWLNAGYAAIAPVDGIDAAFFDAMMQANVRGPVLQLAALAPLLANGASIVVTASTSAYEGGAQASVYAATKGALIALVRCWASALGSRGIRVNALVPGPIDTGFRDFMADDVRRAFEAEVTGRTALGRAGTADEAAAVALFLLSDDSGFVTGSQYAVDGGLVMH